MRGGGKIDHFDPALISANLCQEGATGGCDTSNKTQDSEQKATSIFITQAGKNSVGTTSEEKPHKASLERRHSCDFELETKPNSAEQQSSDSTSSSSRKNSVGVSEKRTQSASSDSAMEKKAIWKTVNGASTEISKGTMRFVGFFKRKLRSRRGKRETAVKEIHISPEDDEERWACRGASGGSSSNNSRASSSTTNYSNSRESSSLEVVHDMEDEYNPEYR